MTRIDNDQTFQGLDENYERTDYLGACKSSSISKAARDDQSFDVFEHSDIRIVSTILNPHHHPNTANHTQTYACQNKYNGSHTLT